MDNNIYVSYQEINELLQKIHCAFNIRIGIHDEHNNLLTEFPGIPKQTDKMKKIAVLFMLMALVLSLPVMASDFTCGTITVDGLISEGEWDAAEWVVLPC